MRVQPREGPADCGGQQGRPDVSGQERCAPYGPSQVPSFGCRPLAPCPPRGPPCSCRPPPRPSFGCRAPVAFTVPRCVHRAADALHGPEAWLPCPGASTAPWWPPQRPRLGCRALVLHRARASAACPGAPPRRWWSPRARGSAAAPRLPLHRAAGALHNAARRFAQSLGLRPGAPGYAAIRASGVRRNRRGLRSPRARRPGGGRQQRGKGTRARREPRARWWRQGAAADTARSSGIVAGDHQGAADPPAARRRRQGTARISGQWRPPAARTPGGRGSRYGANSWRDGGHQGTVDGTTSGAAAEARAHGGRQRRSGRHGAAALLGRC